MDALRHHTHDRTAFGSDAFGQWAERIARFFGTPVYLIGQSLIVLAWVTVNGLAVAGVHFDKYPFILLNLGFSLQAAYAAPLILLAQTRQADRDKHDAEAGALHRQEESDRNQETLSAIDGKLDQLLNRRLGTEPVGTTTAEGDW